jgi:hypothetical protein
MECPMKKSLVTITAVVAILSLGSIASDRAQAGGSMSAPSKYNNASNAASPYQIRNHRLAQTTHVGITEFSSSSAKSPTPKR